MTKTLDRLTLQTISIPRPTIKDNAGNCMDWLPTLSEWQGPIFLRIVDALAGDVASGKLVRGQRLPTHRALAAALDVDLTTVTRAYGEARRRGLLEARVGQGTFVSETTARASLDLPAQVKIDLSMNIPPQPVEANLDLRIADAERIVIYPGSQAIIFNTLLALTSPGDVVLTEALTFPGIKAAAAKLGVRLIGVAMDGEGVRPDALKDACRVHKPKAVYLVPTQHNPTTVTIGPARRKAIAEVVRKSGSLLIEDDTYGPLEAPVAPIASLIPERTYLAASFSQCVAPGLRVAYLLAPDAAAEQIMRSALQATTQMPPPLMVALLTHWIRSGIADELSSAKRLGIPA